MAANSGQCANWNAFRAKLRPSDYTCIQILGTEGRAVTTCDATNVPVIATALRDGTTSETTIGDETYRTGVCGSGRKRPSGAGFS